MRKVVLCLFYALCAFAIAFSLFWMALPAGAPSLHRERTAPPKRRCSGPDLAAQTPARHRPSPPISAPGRGRHGGRLHLRAGRFPTRLARQTDIYVNLLPENDALRVKQGMVVTGDAALQEVLEDLGG